MSAAILRRLQRRIVRAFDVAERDLERLIRESQPAPRPRARRRKAPARSHKI